MGGDVTNGVYQIVWYEICNEPMCFAYGNFV